MSVLAAKRNESRLEVFVLADTIRDNLTELIHRSFGINHLGYFVRKRFRANGKEPSMEDYARYQVTMTESKKRLNMHAALLGDFLTRANSIYPKNLEEYALRRGHQDSAIGECFVLKKELQHIAEVFEADLNLFGESILAIDREIGLIKKWRQSDNQMKAHIEGGV